MLLLYWLTSVASLLGVWLNIKKSVACFWIWSVTNAIWTYADFKHELYAQSALQSVYFLLAIYGICKWNGCIKKKRGKNHEKDSS